jgi:hypothetical protein
MELVVGIGHQMRPAIIDWSEMGHLAPIVEVYRHER